MCTFKRFKALKVAEMKGLTLMNCVYSCSFAITFALHVLCVMDLYSLFLSPIQLSSSCVFDPFQWVWKSVRVLVEKHQTG